MTQLKGLVAATAICICNLGHASIRAEATVVIDSWVMRDHLGNPISLVVSPESVRTNVQSSEILYGLDYVTQSTNRTRLSFENLCTSALVIPGADMGSSACAVGPTGTWTASVSSNAAPTSTVASASTNWSMILQPGQSLSVTGSISVHAHSVGDVIPIESPVGQAAYVEAHFMFIPMLAQTSYLQLIATAGPAAEDETKSGSFSYFATNPWSYPINVYADVTLNPTGTNAVGAIPEPSNWALWLTAIPALAWRFRKGAPQGTRGCLATTG